MDFSENQTRKPLVDELEAAGAVVLPIGVRCPFHDDKHASGSIYQGKDGAWRYHCHTPTCGVSGDVYDLRRKLGKEKPREMPQVKRSYRPPTPTMGKAEKTSPRAPVFEFAGLRASVTGEIEAEYPYLTPEGEVWGVVFRLRMSDGKKSFRQARPVDGKWEWGAPSKPWILFRLEEIQNAREIVVVEGEKAAEALRAIGEVATTSLCGAGKGAHTDWSPLAGKRVYLWPDNDEPGYRHMQEVRDILQTLNPPVDLNWIEPSELQLPAKGDAWDWLWDGMDFGEPDVESKKTQFFEIKVNAIRLDKIQGVRDVLEQVIKGEYESLPWPWPTLDSLTNALLPGKVTILCGTPGSGKSFFLLQALSYWVKSGIRCACWELEDSKELHLWRVLAQEAQCSSIISPEWIRENPDATREMLASHADFLNEIAASFYDATMESVKLETISDWIQKQAEAGQEIICVDPVSVAEKTAKPWEDDQKFMNRVKRIARESGARVILVTHPKDGAKVFDLDDLAGGQAYKRLSHTVLWLVRHKKTKKSTVCIDGFNLEDMGHTISVNLAKVRNGPGNGREIAMRWDSGSLTFEEIGEVL